MKKIVLGLLLISGLFADVNIQDTTTAKQSCEEVMKTGDKKLIAQRGCCSWHQGVCDCSNGRVVCCDGTKSPSCTCKGGKDFTDDVKVVQ